MGVIFTELDYKNFGKCVQLENETTKLIVTVDIGPRIIYYSLKGKANVFNEDINRDTVRDDKKLHDFFETDENWYIYGGHRLWSSPESYPESYTPDNSPVRYEINENSITLMPDDRVKVGERHVITVTLDDKTSEVSVKHAIRNISDFDIRLSAWCMTVAEKGGIEIIPQCKRDAGLLSNRRVVLWSYADIQDERFYISDKYITLMQTEKEKAFKVGVNNEDGWCAYLNCGQLFIKRFDFDKNGVYPDYDVNFETYTNQFIVEIETLSTLETLKPNEYVEYEERWELKECEAMFNPRSDESIDKFVDEYVF